MSTKALVLLTVKPNPYHVECFRKLGHDGYKLYIVVDDNTQTLPQDPDITYVQIDEAVCALTGFCGANFTIPKQYTAWDKALLYFSAMLTHHTHVWFMEDDVFVPTPHTIQNIDERYPTADLLSASNGKNTTGNLETWHWGQAVGKHPLPWACSMVCTIRVSQALLQKVFDYVQVNRTLFFIEIMFNTLALHHGLEVVTPPEMVGVVYNRSWNATDLVATNLYHPVKNVDTMRTFHARFAS